MLRWIWAIPLLPLAGFLANGLLGRRLSKRAIGTIACGAVLASFLLSVGAVVALSGAGEDLGAGGGPSLRWDPEHRRAQVTVGTWIPASAAGALAVDWGFVLDPLSAVMILVVTGVGFLIHVYSIGYMHDDPGYARYFAYLNLFMAMMLTLVLGSSYVVLFVGWEGVGLCSYLLIGFWYQDVAKATAGMKAFLVNRIGDFGFMLGMLLMFVHFGTLDIQTVAAGAGGAGAAVTLIALLLFVGATGKSAQVPLYVWLPDAMAGPTPVSALIHAATMVTAGVYMVARSSVVYVNAPAALATVAVVGAVTAFLAATIALVQTDIKKVLAYSTVSQLGYMFLACGVGAFSAGIFHLVTHAFFKALLFLGAGSVIHAMSGEQEMPRMGGLRAHLPATYRTMLIGALALAGIPPLAGFFSKDEILGKAWEDGHLWLWMMGSVTALLTAFYVFRLIYLTFFGAPRMSAEARHHLHESPGVMTVPLWILAVLSAAGGLLGLPAALGFGNFLEGWLEPALASPPAHTAAEGSGHAAAGGHVWLLVVAALIAVAGWAVARTLYQARPETPARIAARAGGLYRVLKGKYFVDEIYQAVFVRSFFGGAWALDRFDRHVVDGTVNGSGAGVQIAGQIVKLFHTGYVRNYALSFFLGVVFILWFLLVR